MRPAGRRTTRRQPAAALALSPLDGAVDLRHRTKIDFSLWLNTRRPKSLRGELTPVSLDIHVSREARRWMVPGCREISSARGMMWRIGRKGGVGGRRLSGPSTGHDAAGVGPLAAGQRWSAGA
jgi:hypothetical protein